MKKRSQGAGTGEKSKLTHSAEQQLLEDDVLQELADNVAIRLPGWKPISSMGYDTEACVKTHGRRETQHWGGDKRKMPCEV